MRQTRLSDSLRALKSSGLPIGTILDVGIQYATPPLMEVFPDKKHILFEPIEDYFPQIAKNYAAIDHQLIHAAVSDSDGEVNIHSERKTLGNTISHSYIVKEATTASRLVKSLRLDTFLESADLLPPYLLKVDVEGAETPAAILRGAEKTLAQSSAVVIEMTVDRFMERARLLEAAGFGLWDLVDLCYYGDCLWQVDAVFVSLDYKAQIPALRPMAQKPFRPELWQSK